MAYLESLRLLHKDFQKSKFQTVSGYHDLETAFINNKHAGNTLVLRHEMLHDRVLTQTNYGFAQNVFHFAMRSRVSKVRVSAARWCNTLIESSRCTHETYATYLSIKLFAASREAELLETHPIQYQEYFHNLAKIVDPIFTSSFGQYLIGKTIIEICFSSCLLDSLLNWTPDDNAQIIPEHKPDFRLQSSISLWKDELPNLLSILLSEVDKCKTTIGLPSRFNLQCEDDWLNLHSNISGKLDDFLLDLVREWMYPRAEELWACSRPKEWMASRKKFAARICEFSQQNIELGDVDFPGIDPDLAGQAWRAGRFLIDNPIGGHVPFHEVPKDTDPISILQYSPGKKILISDTPSQDTPNNHTWHLFSKTEEGIFTAVRLSHEACLNIFKVRTAIGAMGLPIPDIQLIVCFRQA